MHRLGHLISCLALAGCVFASQVVLKQPEAGDAPDLPSRGLDWGSSLNVISTTDTHCWLAGHLAHGAPESNGSGDWGDLLSFVTRMKQRATRQDVDLIVVDSGDTVDGNGLCDADPVKGSHARTLFREMPYDLLTVGNHELYNYTVARDVYDHFVPHWQGRYLASNVDIWIDGQRRPFAPRFRRWQTAKGLSIFSLGVIFEFKYAGEGLAVQSPRDMVKERWLLDELAKDERIDAFVLVGHIPARDTAWRTILRVLRSTHPHTPVLMFGGHAHIRDCVLPDEWSMIMASGRYMETVGFVGANFSNWSLSRRYLDQNRKTYEYHLHNQSLDTPAGLAVSKRLTELAASLNLSRVLGYAPQSYYLDRYPYSNPASLAWLLTQEVFPKMVVNATRPRPPLMIVNTGSTRFDIFKGPFTVDSQSLVLPFDNPNVFIPDVPRDVAAVLVANLHGEPGDEDARSSVSMHNEAAVASYNAVEAYVKHSFGYVTLDSCASAGGPGDDTPHRPVPAYPLPDYVGTDLPEEGDVIDVAFFDFVGPVITRTLNRLQDERVYTAKDILPYSYLSSSTILGEYASMYWQEDA